MNFGTLDIIIFIIYCLVVIGLSYWVSRSKKGEEQTSEDYFLAGKTLPFWAVGASLIASNISAEQFVAMSGSGFAMGLAISTYEWMAAATLLVVGFFFLPIFIKNNITTMPQFLEKRYNGTVRTLMASFWLLVYVFVNLSSVLYLGALSIQAVMGVESIWVAVIALTAFAIIYSIYGGLMAVAWTDVLQVTVLIFGGLATTYLALELVGAGSVFDGLAVLMKEAPGHFHMILEPGQMIIADGEGGTKDAYMDLPGLSVLIGGMWIINLNYWGFNQYITQRALAAKSLDEAQKGVVFAGFLKILMPIIVVLPGIAAYVLVQKEGMSGDIAQAMMGEEGFVKPDKAYPVLLNLLPVGLKGLAFAALAAAIVSSLASMANSTSTIFTMDIYKNYINQNASEKKLVGIGRIVSLVAFAIAAMLAPQLSSLGQAFQFIQEFTGFVSPGVLAIFLFGFFWKRTTSAAALTAAILTIPLSGVLKFAMPALPFINRMGLVFLILAALMIVISLIGKSNQNDDKGIEITPDLFKSSPGFKIGAFLICGILAALYTFFW